MPTKTFFNIQREKQEKIINAAKNEFSRVPLQEASISKIIKEAEIPRGSFYQYFESKEDLFCFVMKDLKRTIEESIFEVLKKNKGDLIKTFEDSFGLLFDLFSKEENRKLHKNIFVNFNFKMEKAVMPNFADTEMKESLHKFMENIDFEKFTFEDKSQLKYVVKILRGVTVVNLVEAFAKELEKEEALESYKVQLQLIKNGIYR